LNELLKKSADGASMLPSVLPGATLHVRPVERGEVRVGDIVCYLRDGKTVVAELAPTGAESLWATSWLPLSSRWTKTL